MKILSNLAQVAQLLLVGTRIQAQVPKPKLSATIMGPLACGSHACGPRNQTRKEEERKVMFSIFLLGSLSDFL